MNKKIQEAREVEKQLRKINLVEKREKRSLADLEALRKADLEGKRISEKTLVFAKDDWVLTRRLG